MCILGWRNILRGWSNLRVEKELCICTVFCFLSQCDVVSKELLSFDLVPNINNSMKKLRFICVLNGTNAPLKMRTFLYAFATNQKKTFLAKFIQFTGKPLKVIEQNCTL